MNSLQTLGLNPLLHWSCETNGRVLELDKALKTESYFPYFLCTYGSSPHVNPSISIYGSQCHPVYV